MQGALIYNLIYFRSGAFWVTPPRPILAGTLFYRVIKRFSRCAGAFREGKYTSHDHYRTERKHGHRENRAMEIQFSYEGWSYDGFSSKKSEWKKAQVTMSVNFLDLNPLYITTYSFEVVRQPNEFYERDWLTYIVTIRPIWRKCFFDVSRRRKKHTRELEESYFFNLIMKLIIVCSSCNVNLQHSVTSVVPNRVW